MDNGALVFIIVFEAIAIIWLASKLKHYQKFEQLLSTSSQHTGRDATASPAANATVSAAAGQAPGHTVSQVAASSTELNDELLAMPGGESDVNIEEAKRVQLVMARCRYAEFYIEQLDDDYERGQFKNIVESCMATARGISDTFFKSSALHPIILLLDTAGWEDSRDSLMSEVEDDIIRDSIKAELNAQSEQND